MEVRKQGVYCPEPEPRIYKEVCRAIENRLVKAVHHARLERPCRRCADADDPPSFFFRFGYCLEGLPRDAVSLPHHPVLLYPLGASGHERTGPGMERHMTDEHAFGPYLVKNSLCEMQPRSRSSHCPLWPREYGLIPDPVVLVSLPPDIRGERDPAHPFEVKGL